MVYLKHIIPSILILFMAITHTGCKKATQTKLAGTWTLVNIQDLDSETYVEKWTFNSAGNLQVYRETAHAHFLVTSNTAEYKMTTSKFFKVTGFTDATLQYYNYTWEIVYLTKNKLRIVNDQNGGAGLMFKEFKKDEAQ